jgi:hypothetical protein
LGPVLGVPPPYPPESQGVAGHLRGRWGFGKLLAKDLGAVQIKGKIYHRQGHVESVKAQYEKQHSFEEEPGWEPLYWADRYTLKCGDLVRSYVRPVMGPEAIFINEYPILSAPYQEVTVYSRMKGFRKWVVDIFEGGSAQLKDIFDAAEIWVKRGAATGN